MHLPRLILLAALLGDASGCIAQPSAATTNIDRATSLNCAVKLKALIIDIDEILLKKPRNLNDVNAVFHRHFPIDGCTVDEVSETVKASRYFQSMSMNGPTQHVYLLNSETSSSRGVAVSFGLTERGELVSPFAIWSPPFW
jgi:hypothetical protein